MSNTNKKQTSKFIILIILAVIIGGGIALLQLKSGAGNEESIGTAIPGAQQIGGPFDMVDHDGHAVSEKTYAGQYKLLFFGFTFCPAICPSELGKMTQVMDMLSPKDAEKIQPIFVTSDPARDKPSVMAEYLSSYHPKIVGLTGTQEQVDEMLAQYRVYARKVEMEGMDGYMMDHSTFMYLMGPSDSLVSIYQMDDTAKFIADDIQKQIN